MLQEQRHITSTEAQKTQKNMLQNSLSSRLLYSLLVGVGVVLVLTLLEAIFILLLNPFNILGDTSNRLLALFTLPVNQPGALLVPTIEFLVAFGGTFFMLRPLSLFSYFQAVHTAQEEYHKLYTPLTALTNIRKAPDRDRYKQDALTGEITVASREEQISILDLVQQQDTHQLILGVPGAGKTTALRVYQYIATQEPFKLITTRERVPVYVPMKNYSLFLKQRHASPVPGQEAFLEEEPVTLFDFLGQSDLPGMRYLRPHLQQLAQQGRLLLLCDGLNEIDSNYLSHVSKELVGLMRDSQNRLVMTCREIDYREQREFEQLVNEGRAVCAVIYPLHPEQVREFVERYVARQDKRWRHTAGQITQVIDRSRLRYHCTNPMMLFTLMEIIDRIGIERGRQIDTRGRLLREFVRQLISYEQQQLKWYKNAPPEREVIRFLSEVACAARWANDRNAIQLRIAPGPITSSSSRREITPSLLLLADELQYWLDEHPAKGPFALAEDAEPLNEPYDDLPRLLQFSLSAALIEVSPSGVVSFRHELIAEYFVAEYFYNAGRREGGFSTTSGEMRAITGSHPVWRPGKTLAPVREELLEHVGRWSEPIAIWAGLLEYPMALAERFGSYGRNNPAYVLQALALGLVCVGVLWAPPQADVQRIVMLPPSMEEALSIAVRNRKAREELARIFTRCAEEGGQEVYRSLLPLIMVEGVDELLTLLDQTIVPELLFTHLEDAVDNVAYEAQVKRLSRVLGRFGGVVVERAAQLSLPMPEHSSRLRAAAINILGGTGDPAAVSPLIERLSDADLFIVERATNALIRLGPTPTLVTVLQELENRNAAPFQARVHKSALTILGRFMDEQDVRRQVTIMQYLRILETIVPVLTSNYLSEPEIQQQAREILVRQARTTSGAGARDNRYEKVIEALMRYLPSQNEVAVHNVTLALQEIGPLATSRLLEQLNQPSEIVRARVIEILRTIRDARALPRLLRFVGDPAPLVQQQAALALQAYAPDSISGLIDLVLTASEPIADRAAQILSNIGEPVVIPIINVVFHIVPGRTRLLVQVLAHVQDNRAIPALVTLLQSPQLDQAATRETSLLLTITIVRALSQFPDQQVVAPLVIVLAHPDPQVYEEVIDALSRLGVIALDGLVETLDVPVGNPLLQRARRAILGMTPFPGEQLVDALAYCSEAQAQQIIAIFKMQGTDAAQVLVRYLLYTDERIRHYVYQALDEMQGPVVVPALLEVLNQPPLRKVVNGLLLKHPGAALTPLVNLLGEYERGDAAAALLPHFGTKVLRALVAGLDDQRGMARELSQRVIISLVRQSEQPQEVLPEIVRLFHPALPQRAHESLLSVLTTELADVSVPALLEGLEDAHLLEDAAKGLVRLSRRTNLQQVVLDSLIQALHQEDRRRGAETALVWVGGPAVPYIGELIIHQDQAVEKASQRILREIGVPALPFIWTTMSDRSVPARRQAALEVFHSMRTEVIKDELVSLLMSDKPDDIAMAVALLLERIGAEAGRHYADREMIPELIEYVQTHGGEQTSLRVISLLLMLGEHAILEHLVQSLDGSPHQNKQLINALLLLGHETEEALLPLFSDPEISQELRSELASVLAMMGTSDPVIEAAQKLSAYGMAKTKTSILFPEHLTISLRALGGLLAAGHWNVRTIQEMRDASKEGSPTYELFNVLLGWRYEPQLTRLREEVTSVRDTLQKEIATLTVRLVAEQKQMQTLRDELEDVRKAHGTRGDQLNQTKQEKDAMRLELDKAQKDKDLIIKDGNVIKAKLDSMTKERDTLRAQLQKLLQGGQSTSMMGGQSMIGKLPPKP